MLLCRLSARINQARERERESERDKRERETGERERGGIMAQDHTQDGILLLTSASFHGGPWGSYVMSVAGKKEVDKYGLRALRPSCSSRQ